LITHNEMIIKTLFYGLFAFFALAVTLYSCYHTLDIHTPDDEVIACSNDHDYRMNGNYYIISDVDSLKGDEVEIKKDSSIVYANRLDSLTWELLGKGKLSQTRIGDSLILRS